MDAGVEIRAARLRAGLSQAALAARAGTSQPTLSAYETGAKQPSVATLERLLAAAGMRLAVAPRAAPVVTPSRAERERAGRALRDVLELAAALPVRHERRLAYPRLPAPRGDAGSSSQ